MLKFNLSVSGLSILVALGLGLWEVLFFLWGTLGRSSRVVWAGSVGI